MLTLIVTSFIKYEPELGVNDAIKYSQLWYMIYDFIDFYLIFKISQ